MTAVPGAVSDRHLDYIQRNDVLIQGLNLPGLVAVTAPPATDRLVSRVLSIGSEDKTARPTPRSGWKPLTVPVLVGLAGMDVPLAFRLASLGRGLEVEWGCWRDSAVLVDLADNQRVVQRLLASVYLDPQYERDPTQPDRTAYPPRALAGGPSWYHGLVLGIPDAPSPLEDGALAVDRLWRAMQDDPGAGAWWQVLVLAQPVLPGRLTDLRDHLLEEIRRADADPQGRGNPLVAAYLKLLGRTLENYTDALRTGGWRVAVYLSGTAASFPRLTSAWRSLFSGRGSIPEPVRVVQPPGIGELQAHWAVPNRAGAPGPGHYSRPYELQTLLTSAQLAGYLQLPAREAPGFAVRSSPPFDTVLPGRAGHRTIQLGPVLHGRTPTGDTYPISVDDLTRHAFIGGVTGSGKTQTITRILEHLSRPDQGEVPFLVLEPAKTEYRKLTRHQPFAGRLSVFTPGDETIAPLRLNPFEIEPGTPLAAHIDLLKALFTASFGMWNPMPQVLERALHEMYRDRGWDPATGTNPRVATDEDRALAWPTLTDLADKVDTIINNLGYTGEVVSNLHAGLTTRINGLRIGGKGRLLDVPMSDDSALLFDRPAVIELEAMGDDDDKAFVMGLILLKLAEHRRTQGELRSLRHLLVIEEAHRLLANTATAQAGADPAFGNPRGKAVDTFVNILAEIRSLGQGVLVTDQVPVRLAPEVLKNSNLKIAHRLVAADDRNALAGTMAMNDKQSTALSTLERGQAAVFSEGDDTPLLVHVTPRLLSGGANPGDEPAVSAQEIRRYVAGLGSSRLASSGAADTAPGPHWGAIWDDARSLAEDPSFRRAVSRYALSIGEDATAAVRLIEDIEWLCAARRPLHHDGPAFAACVISRGTSWLGSLRGAQHGWPFREAHLFSRTLGAVLLAALRRQPVEEAVVAYQALCRRLFSAAGPYPECQRICAAVAPQCFYRTAVADWRRQGVGDDRWRSASESYVRDPAAGLVARQEASFSAADDLVEPPDPRWPDARKDAAVQRHVRVAFCYAQQALLEDPHISMWAGRIALRQLLDRDGQGVVDGRS